MEFLFVCGYAAPADFDNVESDVDGGTVEIGLRVTFDVRRNFASEKPEEERLKHVFGIFRVAGNPVGCPIDQIVMISEHPLEILRQGAGAGFRCGCSQVLFLSHLTPQSSSN